MADSIQRCTLNPKRFVKRLVVRAQDGSPGQIYLRNSAGARTKWPVADDFAQSAVNIMLRRESRAEAERWGYVIRGRDMHGWEIDWEAYSEDLPKP